MSLITIVQTALIVLALFCGALYGLELIAREALKRKWLGDQPPRAPKR